MRTVHGHVRMEIGDVEAFVIWDGDVAWVDETLIDGKPIDLGHYAIRDNDGWLSIHEYIIDQLG